MTSREAASVLEAYCLQEHGKPPSSTLTGKKNPRPEACDEDWWSEHRGFHDDPRSPRNRAYLAAYRHLTRADEIPAGGVPLTDGTFMWLDRAVMKTMVHYKIVRFDACTFVLTDDGKKLVASVPRPASVPAAP